MKKTLSLILCILIVFISGCAALKSKGGVGKTIISEQFEPTLQNVLVVSKVSYYDTNFSDNVAPYFRNHVSEALSSLGVRNAVIEVKSEENATSKSLIKLANESGYDNVMLVSFFSIVTHGNTKFMKYGVIQAKIWDVKSSKSNWSGLGGWERGLSDYESSDNAGKVLSDLVINLLEQNYVFKNVTR